MHCLGVLQGTSRQIPKIYESSVVALFDVGILLATFLCVCVRYECWSFVHVELELVEDCTSGSAGRHKPCGRVTWNSIEGLIVECAPAAAATASWHARAFHMCCISEP